MERKEGERGGGGERSEGGEGEGEGEDEQESWSSSLSTKEEVSFTSRGMVRVEKNFQSPYTVTCNIRLSSEGTRACQDIHR